MNVSAATNALVSRPCEICAIFGHIGVDYQLGNAINGVEQMNYAQYNQGMRQNQIFFLKPLTIPMDKWHHLAMQTIREPLRNLVWNF